MRRRQRSSTIRSPLKTIRTVVSLPSVTVIVGNTQQVLASLFRTIQQRDLDAAALLTDIRKAPGPIVPLALAGVQQ